MKRHSLSISGVAAALVMLAYFDASAAPKRGAARFVALGEGDTWTMVDTIKRAAIPIHLPSGFHPTDLAVSEDGSLVAFTSDDPSDPRQARLFVWRPNTETPPQRIGEERGYYADPRFDADGAWIIVAHNSLGRGSPMNHLNQAYAQLYRVRTDGTEFQQLTDESGCHFAPTITEARAISYVHAECHGPRRYIETSTLEQGKPKRRQYETTKTMDEVRISADGSRAIFTATGLDTIAIDQVDLRTGSTKTLVEFPMETPKARIEFGANGEVLFLRQHAIWSVRAGAEKKLAELGGF